AKTYGKRLAEKAIAEKLSFVVERVDVGLDSKAISEGINEFHKVAEQTPIIWISVAELEIKSKVMVKINVPGTSPLAKVLNAKDWLNSAVALINGRGGGNAVDAQAQGLNYDNIAEKWLNFKFRLFFYKKDIFLLKVISQYKSMQTFVLTLRSCTKVEIFKRNFLRKNLNKAEGGIVFKKNEHGNKI
ncbi:hypothetical protein RFI_11521, partial [Reticulomyxa filosa]